MPIYPARFRRRTLALALAGAAFALPTAAAPATHWSTQVTVSPIGAHSIGNPAAKVRLVEYFSYTCNHCAEFARLAATPLKTLYVDKGLVQIEYRNMVRDPFDMTAALLARCGDAGAFSGNHLAILAAQPQWLANVTGASDAQMTSWYQGSIGERARKIAADTGLSALMRGRGYSDAQLGICLDSEVALAEITAMTNLGRNSDGVIGTPSFFINGRMVDDTKWPAVKTRLDLAIKAP